MSCKCPTYGNIAHFAPASRSRHLRPKPSFPVSVALSCCVGARCLGPWDGGIRTRWLRSISPTKIWVWLLRNAGFGGLRCEREHLCVLSLSQPWPIDDRIFDCLLASMAAVQAEDVRASFLFVGDLNGHHQEWLPVCYTTHEETNYDYLCVILLTKRLVLWLPVCYTTHEETNYDYLCVILLTKRLVLWLPVCYTTHKETSVMITCVLYYSRRDDHYDYMGVICY